MSQTNVLVYVAGAALSIGAQALAQNANLDQSRAFQAELVADAGNRASLLQGGVGGNATYAGTFSIADATGNNRLNIGGTELFRYTASFRSSSAVGSIDDTTLGFSTPVTRLRFWGNIWDKALTFKIQGNFGGTSSDTGVFGLEDAYAMYSWDNGFSVKWGQYKTPLLREVSVEDEFQQGADRSVTSYIFGQGYSQGIQFQYAADAFRIAVGVTDGIANSFSGNPGTANTDFNSPLEADYAINARADWKVMGADWERFNDFTSWRSAPDNALLIGAAGEYEKGGNTGFTHDDESYRYTVDASFEGQGWNVFAAGYGSHFKTGATKFDDFGAVAQAGFFVTDQVELFARWDACFFDKDRALAHATLHFASGGVNYYISPESHAAKLTGQVGYSFNDTSGISSGTGVPDGNTRNGFLGEAHKGEIALIGQLQIVF
jgi:hypothetical protein